MKRDEILIILGLFFLSLTSGCVYVVDAPGPDGRTGSAFFGVDYRTHMPYSYADNNPAIPYNPILGSYYPTNAGVYEFEYFINPYDYWYGTYRIFVNPGERGLPNGQPGRDGRDTYLMLICNHNGFYELRGKDGIAHEYRNEPLKIEGVGQDFCYEIVMQRANTSQRPAQLQPKFIGQ